MVKTSQLLAVFSLAIAIFPAVCVLRTLWLGWTRPDAPTPCHVSESDGYVTAEEGWSRLKRAVQLRTISRTPDDYNREELNAMRDYLLQEYRDVFALPAVDYEVVNEYSLLITVRGTDPTATPYMMMAHTDVVPVVEAEWTVDPFAGSEREDVMYGRGVLDCKTAVIGLLEALRYRTSHGPWPRKSFFLAFGHDEEVGGRHGAHEIARLLQKRGVHRLEFIVDEGIPGFRANFIAGISKDIVNIGVTEKGLLNLNLSVRTDAGHSSMPPPESSIGIISNAVTRLEQNQFGAVMDEVTAAYFHALSFDMNFPMNIICSNLWLFGPVVARVLARGITQAFVRTTTALTMIGGGTKSNVIPSHAWAVINHRVHPSLTVEQVAERDRVVIGDARVTITPMPPINEAHPISPHDVATDAPYRVVHKSARQVFPAANVAPGTMVAATDTRHYHSFTKHIFRIHPFVLDRSQVQSIHGHDERISRSQFESAINFYYHVMLNADAEEYSTDVAQSDNREL